MSKRSILVLFTGALFITVLFSSRAAYGQGAAAAPLTDDHSATAVVSNNGENTTSEAMQAQIIAQQREINELKERLKKLEILLEANSPNQTANTVSRVNYTTSAPVNTANPPSPAPLPALMGTTRTSRELLPDIGHIGAEIGLLIGGSQNPFKSKEGFFAGGFIDLPLKKMKRGKLSYEIMIGAQRTVSTQTTTSGVTALVNSALNNALGLPPSVNNLFGPLPITNQVRERLTVLTVVPASFKYTYTDLDRNNIRPYVVVGLGTYVGLSSQKLFDFDAAKYVNNPAVASLLNALLNGAQVGGLAPIAPELRNRGLSAGQGDFRFGLNAGGGVEFRISPKFSMGFDYRINKIEGKNGTFSTFSAKPTVHF